MVDYSKWKDIEISDDEDDTHPNIDTPSLFRWRHQARLERMEEREKEKMDHERRKQETLNKLKETKEKVADLESKSVETPDLNALKKALKELENKKEEIKEKEEELKKKEKLTPWNIDTIAQEGFTKTVINKKPPRRDDDSSLSDEEKERKIKQFVKDNEKKLKEYGMLRKYEDSKKFLQENLHLACQYSVSYLHVWCTNLEMEKKHDLMKRVAHQFICVQYIVEISKELDHDLGAFVGPFFSSIQVADSIYRKIFDVELREYKKTIRKEVAEKIAEKELEEEKDKKARIGPGGLDCVEVFQSLPEAVQKCLEAQDNTLLGKTLTEMSEAEAWYHMQRLIDCGIWVPNAKTKEKNDASSEKI